MSATITIEPTPAQERGDLRARALRWMARHPEAMAAFERLALDAAARGRVFGIGLLAERVRWDIAIEKGDDRYVVNNDFRAYIARELVHRHPHLARHLRFRRTKYDP